MTPATNPTEGIALQHRERLRSIALTRWGLLRIRNWRVHIPGDPEATAAGREAPTVVVSGLGVFGATSRLSQGEWLAKLVVLASKRARGPVEVLELGSSVGISGMYLLAGLAEADGGRLITFEGSPEIAALAKANLGRFKQKHDLRQVDFEVVVGAFEATFEARVRAATKPFDLVFIDGHHQEQPTLRYHAIVNSALAERGIIVHDDIDQTSGMIRAWRAISEAEKDHLIVELYQGNRPSRGVILRGQPPIFPRPRFHFDKWPERLLREARDSYRRARNDRASP